MITKSTKQKMKQILQKEEKSVFLNDIKDGKVDGFSQTRTRISYIDNQDMKDYLALKDDFGILVSRVDIADTEFLENDVLVSINGKKISSNAFFNENHESSPLKYIYKSLSVIANSNNNLELGGKDVDIFRNGTVQELASLEAKYSKHLYPNSFRSGSKTIFSYTNDKFIVDRMYELLRGYKTCDKGKFTLLNELSTDIYAKNSYWLNQLKQAMPDSDNFDTTFSDIFEFGYLSLDALKKQRSESSDRSLADMSSKEIIAIKQDAAEENSASD